jgi:AcrR family transcriptional regulator
MVDSSIDGAPLGLRERTKVKRRAAIQRAALELFIERGYEATTIADVAERAEVARRTVMMYFPAKIDLALSWSGEIAARLNAAFDAHPDTDFIHVLEQWLDAEIHTQDPALASLAWDMLEAHPQIRALGRNRLVEQIEAGGAEAFALQIGLAPDHPAFAIAGAAVGAATEEYLATTARRGYSPQLHQSFLRLLHRITDAT